MMKVVVNGKEEQREIAYYEPCAATGHNIPVPVLAGNERYYRTATWEVHIVSS